MRHRKRRRGQQTGGAGSRVRVQVLHGASIVVHVQNTVCMVMVTGILGMHSHVFQLPGTLCQDYRTEHCY